MHIIKLSVRALCEFVLRQGDIDSRFSGVDRAGQGTRIHKKLQKAEDENYKAEVTFKTSKIIDAVEFKLDGRADGVYPDSDGIQVIDEIKTTTAPTTLLTEDFCKAHWAQGMCYAYIMCENENFDTAKVRLTYYQTETDEIVRHIRSFSKAELENSLLNLLTLYMPWALMTLNWASARNMSIKETVFPFEEYRSGQYELARAVYKTVKIGENLLACAPTGIGKTMSTLFPSIKAMGEGLAERIFYLTAKTITRQAAQDAVFLLRKSGTLRLKTLTLTAKDKVCFLDERECTPEACPYAKGYYDRVNNAILKLLASEDVFDRENIERFAKEETLCPFELALDLSLWCDVIIGDYNYLFDPVVSLKRFFEREKGEYIFLVDEAHNLADRARSMYTAELNKQDFYEVKKLLPKNNKPLINALTNINKFFIELRKQNVDAYTYTDENVGKELAVLCENFIDKATKWLDDNKQSDAHKNVLGLFFNARFYMRIFELYDEHFTTLIHSFQNNISVKLLCLDPSLFIASSLSLGHASALFSATLVPFDYFENTLGVNECKRICLDSPFNDENLCLLCVDNLSTKYLSRESSLNRLTQLIYTAISPKKGNYIVFFPSHKYMQTAYDCFMANYPEINCVMQQSAMSEDDREEFLKQFQCDNHETMLAFCVLGGIFAEGIDLVGERLVGSIIVGVGLPQISAQQNEYKEYFEKTLGDGFAYAYQLPGFNKVLQAAGRVIRTNTDKGIVLLIDERYGSYRYKSLFPRHWQKCKYIKTTEQLQNELDCFWTK